MTDINKLGFTPFPEDGLNYRDALRWLFQDYGEIGSIPREVMFERLKAARSAGLDLTLGGMMLDEQAWEIFDSIRPYISFDDSDDVVEVSQ
tara:strand:+ start:190 stop:462 length:273 start_codon:yes stop_codon:yes gene_type:complete